jgi:hypothetical protein
MAVDPDTDEIDPQTWKPVQLKQTLLIASVESARLSNKYLLDQRFIYLGTGPNTEPLIRQDVISQGWIIPHPPNGLALIRGNGPILRMLRSMRRANWRELHRRAYLRRY